MKRSTPIELRRIRAAAVRSQVTGRLGGASSRRLHLRAEQGGQRVEVQHPADQVRLLADAEQAAPPEAPQAMPVLPFAEEFLDLLPRPLRQAIPVSARAHAHPRM